MVASQHQAQVLLAHVGQTAVDHVVVDRPLRLPHPGPQDGSVSLRLVAGILGIDETGEETVQLASRLIQ
jgi:hypothetical protein